jgi:DNA polymerase-3 subunit gamma/tau
MSYQVLARKWRPRSFSEMIGQEHVVRALVNALDHDRLHHAYLFTGTRGVGKTTVARIFAKALNCEQGVSSTPCGVCASCRELDEGRFVDLIEVDAASRTKVEDTRDLLDYVQYAPTRGRYKVYLIDEVHMLSRHSFNALLKTLEEPPPHIKFLLATTDPQRLPVTILSRCLQFNLRRMPEDLIGQHLSRVLGEESIPADAAAIAHIARAADGSVRDALSLLDQAIAYGGGRLGDAEVRAMLGTIDRGHVYDLLDALAAGDGAALLEGVQRAAEYTVEFSDLLGELLSALQRIAVAQLVPQAKADEGDADAARIAALAAALSREDVQLYYQIALIGRRDLPYCPDARTGV